MVGQEFCITRTDANVVNDVTIVSTGGENINEGDSYILPSQYSGVVIWADATQYYAVATGASARRGVTTSGAVIYGDSMIQADATGGAVTLTLPDATTCVGEEYCFVKVDSSGNAVIVSATFRQHINGATTQTLAARIRYPACPCGRRILWLILP